MSVKVDHPVMLETAIELKKLLSRIYTLLLGFYEKRLPVRVTYSTLIILKIFTTYVHDTKNSDKNNGDCY